MLIHYSLVILSISVIHYLLWRVLVPEYNLPLSIQQASAMLFDGIELCSMY
jgi:hypothetical protein